MLREDVEAQLRARYGEDGYLFPAYGDYCFANVPGTVASILGGEAERLGAPADRVLPDDVLDDVPTEVETVLVVLLDGFGFEHWKRDHRDHTLLRRITERGRVTPLTSIYPSETAAATTTFHTGRLAAGHGVIGWIVNEPRIDGSFEALPFRTKAGERPDLDPADVADAESIYPTLRASGIDVHHVVPLPESAAGAIAHSYEGLDDVPASLDEALSAAEPPAYVYAYLPDVDHVSHESGTESDDYEDVLASVCAALEDAFSRIDAGTAEDTLLVVAADHGHVDTIPDRNVDLTTYDVVEENLQTHADGTPIRFAGSPRNVHLHLQPGSVERLRDALAADLDALVLTAEEVVDRGLFGPEPSETLRRRLGDLVVSHRDLSVWWGDDVEPEELEHVGMHGGLNPREMLVPFAAVALSEVV